MIFLKMLPLRGLAFFLIIVILGFMTYFVALWAIAVIEIANAIFGSFGGGGYG